MPFIPLSTFFFWFPPPHFFFKSLGLEKWKQTLVISSQRISLLDTQICFRIKKILGGNLHKELLINEGKQTTMIKGIMTQVMYREELMTDVSLVSLSRLCTAID